ncbi:glycosyltransferase family 8 protein [Luteococcus sp. OSA5]|uniref:glycosyltransferase family 8 protein n=1 Tax=Luteococcus sp. OSA5 TaxID=3401630 RepID=UPI003B439D56
MHVTYVADENVLDPLVASLTSLALNGSELGTVYVTIVCCGMEANDLKYRLPRLGGLEIGTQRLTGAVLEEFPSPNNSVSGHYTRAVYVPLLLPKVLPKSVNRTIYLDCDTLVLGSLDELWGMDLGGRGIAAVRDRYVQNISSRFGVSFWRELGICPELRYFNSGVMLVDVQLWRRESVTERARVLLEHFDNDIEQHDQEVLNALFAGNWLELSDEWNTTNFWRRSSRRYSCGDDMLERAIVRHFAGELKPWVPHDPSELPDGWKYWWYLKLFKGEE